MEKEIKFDLDGQELITNALIALLASYPGLGENGEILFSELSDTGGRAFFPTGGAAIYKEQESVTGHVRQICQYPFTVVHRAAPNTEMQRVSIKEFLDTLGRWLEKQPVMLNGVMERLTAYPTLTHGRVITGISRKTPGYRAGACDNGAEDWAIELILKYTNEFDR